MVIRKPKKSAVISQGEHDYLVGKIARADSLIEEERDKITPYQAAITEQETKLLAIGTRHQDRATRRCELDQALETARAVWEQAQLDAELSGNSNEYLAAERAFVEARNLHGRETKKLTYLESCDSDEAGGAQNCKVSAERQIAAIEKRIAGFEQARETAIQALARHTHETIDMQFSALADQRAAAEQVLSDLDKQHNALVETARSRLIGHPEHLAALLNKHVVYEDDASRLVAANIAWRKALLQAGPGLPIASLISTAQLNAIWLHVDPDTRPDWLELDLEDIEKWLEGYREHH